MATFGTLGIFVKNIALSSAEIALWRAIVATLVLLTYMVVTKRLKMIRQSGRNLIKLALSGAAMGFNWIFLFEAYRYTSVALSTLSYYFAPTLVIVASAVFLKEKLDTKQIICFIISTSGIVLIIGVSGGGSNDILGVLYGLAAAVLYATVVMFNKASAAVDGITRTYLQFVAAMIVLIPYVKVTEDFHIGTLETNELLLLLIIGVVHTGIMYVLYFTSLSHVRGQQAAILSYIDPVVAVLLSVFALHEQTTLLQMLGGVLILVATAANELTFSRKVVSVSTSNN
ncbi:DMT family transporter [Pleomorphochaeta sp. DL1XJH-081]|uniref:DMT family transporter n=1 Tax=Pleomorphochaeta sp. DL1XJH-081 TaxID=3409690 RepID=UPI003BB53650